MEQEIKLSISNEAKETLHSLFYRGALESGDLPSKSGAAELRDLGWAETRHTKTPYNGNDYFTFLTAEGQRTAIHYFADTRWGELPESKVEVVTIEMNDLSGMTFAANAFTNGLRAGGCDATLIVPKSSDVVMLRHCYGTDHAVSVRNLITRRSPVFVVDDVQRCQAAWNECAVGDFVVQLIRHASMNPEEATRIYLFRG